MNILGKTVDASILTNAVRALGHEPFTCPADYASGICRIEAADPIFPDYRLQNLAEQFGLDVRELVEVGFVKKRTFRGRAYYALPNAKEFGRKLSMVPDGMRRPLIVLRKRTLNHGYKAGVWCEKLKVLLTRR